MLGGGNRKKCEAVYAQQLDFLAQCRADAKAQPVEDPAGKPENTLRRRAERRPPKPASPPPPAPAPKPKVSYANQKTTTRRKKPMPQDSGVVVAAAADASASAAEAQDETDAAAADDDASQDTAAPDDDDVVRAPPPLDDVLEAWARAQWPDPRLDDSASVLQCLFGDARYSPDVAAAVRTELHAALFDSASTAKRFDADHDEEWDQDFEWEWIPGPPKLDKLELRHLGPEINDAEPEPSPSEPRRLPTFPLSDAAGPASPRVLNRDSSGARLDEFFRVEYFKKTQGAVLSHLEPIPTRM